MKRNHITLFGFLLGLFLPLITATAQTPAPGKWEPAIAAFEQADKTNPPPQRAILFVGSSSIRGWKTVASDFPQHKVINRGFGGSQVADSVRYADRIVIPYRPKAVVFYAGDNDLAAGKSPEKVFADFQAFVGKVHESLPRTKIVFIAIKPSPSRWKLKDKSIAANRLIQSFCESDARLAFVDIFTPMLGKDGLPREELFLSDKLHMNRQGYDLWTAAVKPHLARLIVPPPTRR